MIQLTLKESGVARLSLLHPTLDLYMSRIQSSLMSGIPTDLRRQIFVREPEICPQLRSGQTPPVPKIAIIAHLAWDHIQRIHTLRCGPSVHPIRKVRWQKVQALLSDKKKRMGRSYGFMQALAGEFRSRIVFIPTYSFQHFYLLAFLYTSSIDRSWNGNYLPDQQRTGSQFLCARPKSESEMGCSFCKLNSYLFLTPQSYLESPVQRVLRGYQPWQFSRTWLSIRLWPCLGGSLESSCQHAVPCTYRRGRSAILRRLTPWARNARLGRKNEAWREKAVSFNGWNQDLYWQVFVQSLLSIL